jgi:hypothetical protein
VNFDSQFNAERFINPEHLIEGRFVDRKAEIYPIFDKNHSDNQGDLDYPRKLHDFVVDVIAFANMSYRHGRVARILFGVNNNHELVGVKQQSTKPEHLQGIDYSSSHALEVLFREHIEKDFRSAFKEFVEPSEVTLQMPWDEVGGVLVAYLEIGAQLGNPTFYRVKKDLVAGKKRLVKGQAFKREGESNSPFTDQDYNWWPSYNECPVIPGDKWRLYFEHLLGLFGESKALIGYQEPLTTRGTLLNDEIRDFLTATDRSLLVIEGRAGLGKTKYLERLVFDLATEALPYVQDVPDEQPPNTWIPIFKALRDVSVHQNEMFEQAVLRWWNRKGIFFNHLHPQAQRILSLPTARWVVCLDALDEMDPTSIKHFCKALQRFNEEYPNVKVIVTSRHDALSLIWEEAGCVVHMGLLNEDAIENFLAGTLLGQDENEYNYAARLRQEDPGLRELTRVPLLDAYVRSFSSDPLPEAEPKTRYSIRPTTPKTQVPSADLVSVDQILTSEALENEPDSDSSAVELERDNSHDDSLPDGKTDKESSLPWQSEVNNQPEDEVYLPPSKSQILDRMLNQVWAHDLKHHVQAKDPLSAPDALERLKQLAAGVDGKKYFDKDWAERTLKKRAAHRLRRFLSLGVVEYVENENLLTFSNQMFQAFMAAAYLQRLWRLEERYLISRVITDSNIFWEETLVFFSEMAFAEEAIRFVKQQLARFARDS